MKEGDDLKSRVCRDSVKELARHLGAVDPKFPTRRFVRRATSGLDELELKARIGHVADALAESLPEPFPKAAALVRDVSARVRESEPSIFAFWPVCTFVERRGLAHFDEAFATMHDLTGIATCEFALRPFLEVEPERSFAQLERWVEDKDHHVRRLVSEGTRPRLPWGSRLRALQKDPSRSIELLDRLMGDEELYVRRSVANHLNDISKDHPDLAVEVATRWKSSSRSPTDEVDSAEVDWVVRHALRGLVKQGHGGALALQGFGPPRVEVERFDVSPHRLRFGSPLKLELNLRAKAAGEWMVDYAVHRVLADGRLSAKVFKWTRREVKRGERLVLSKTHSIRAISTRTYYPGTHRCEVLINGKSCAIEDFELTDVPVSRPRSGRS